MLQNGHAHYFIALTGNPAGPLHLGANLLVIVVLLAIIGIYIAIVD
jgi:hypothetical protein